VTYLIILPNVGFVHDVTAADCWAENVSAFFSRSCFEKFKGRFVLNKRDGKTGGEKLLGVGYILDSISVGKAHDTSSVPFPVDMTAFVAHGRSVLLCHLIRRTRRLASHITESGGRS